MVTNDGSDGCDKCGQICIYDPPAIMQECSIMLTVPVHRLAGFV